MRFTIRIATLFLPGAPPIVAIARVGEPTRRGRPTARPLLPAWKKPVSSFRQ